jgi:hypothetical protein
VGGPFLNFEPARPMSRPIVDGAKLVCQCFAAVAEL